VQTKPVGDFSKAVAQRALERLDRSRFQASIEHFPRERAAAEETAKPAFSNPATVYDPVFMLPLLHAIVSTTGSVFLRELVEVEALGYLFLSLTSACTVVRGMASTVLGTLFDSVDAEDHRDRLQVCG
jgi:hypothetical protein